MLIKILDTGKGAYVEVDGKTMGEALSCVEYKNPGNHPATLRLELEADKPAFMPDGYFDRVCQAVERTFDQTGEKEVPAETDVSAGQDVKGQ